MLMKSSSSSLYIALLYFIFNLPLLVQAFSRHIRYVYVPLKKTWPEALRYCRAHHTDLATFMNKNDYDARPNLCPNYEFCWIGLRKDKHNPQVLKWSDGEESTFTRWDYYNSQPNGIHGKQNCVATTGRFWHDIECNFLCTFICYKNTEILVKENKTWEEALEHCRTLGANPHSSYTRQRHRYDLTHVHVGSNNLDAMRVIQEAQTQEVWIGLRFLAGSWLWSDGTSLQEQLPTCPAPNMYCGTMSKTGELLLLRNCVERRNFLCLRN